jgi:hypothetical protein
MVEVAPGILGHVPRLVPIWSCDRREWEGSDMRLDAVLAASTPPMVLQRLRDVPTFCNGARYLLIFALQYKRSKQYSARCGGALCSPLPRYHARKCCKCLLVEKKNSNC